MKESNFDWTDTTSIKWFILFSHGYEGPYTLAHLQERFEKNNLSLKINVWSEGLKEPLSFHQLLEYQKTEENICAPDDELPPPLPKEITITVPPTESSFKKLSLIVGALVLILLTTILFYEQTNRFYFSRLPKMPIDTHRKILSENSLDLHGKDFTFREYISQDYSLIWLISNGRQNCDVHVTFSSNKNKLLSMNDEEIVFTSRGHLTNHVAELSSFEFIRGTRIVPGIYNMDVTAHDCKWDGLRAQINNFFTPMISESNVRRKVILFSKGEEEFNKTLNHFLVKKELKEKKEKELSLSHREDVVQRLQTLEAMSLQIEQHFLTFLKGKPKEVKLKIDPMIEQYSRKFGSFLTSFVVENERRQKLTSARDQSQHNNIIKLITKDIGFESMKLIEEIQLLSKVADEKKLSSMVEKVKLTFSHIQKKINQKVLENTPPQDELEN